MPKYIYIRFFICILVYPIENIVIMNSGYSGTPLVKKLGLKDGFKCLLYNAPKEYLNWLNNLEQDVYIRTTITKESTNFIHVFCTTEDNLETVINTYKPALLKNGMLWVSWPKGSSGIKTNLKRDMIRDYILANGLVDVKVAAIDENWSGLKFVYRLKDRTNELD